MLRASCRKNDMTCEVHVWHIILTFNLHTGSYNEMFWASCRKNDMTYEVHIWHIVP